MNVSSSGWHDEPGRVRRRRPPRRAAEQPANTVAHHLRLEAHERAIRRLVLLPRSSAARAVSCTPGSRPASSRMPSQPQMRRLRPGLPVAVERAAAVLEVVADGLEALLGCTAARRCRCASSARWSTTRRPTRPPRRPRPGTRTGKDAREHASASVRRLARVERRRDPARSAPRVRVWQRAQEPSRLTCVSIGCVTRAVRRRDGRVCVGVGRRPVARLRRSCPPRSSCTCRYVPVASSIWTHGADGGLPPPRSS